MPKLYFLELLIKENSVNSQELSPAYIFSSSVHKQLKSLLQTVESAFWDCSFSFLDELILSGHFQQGQLSGI